MRSSTATPSAPSVAATSSVGMFDRDADSELFGCCGSEGTSLKKVSTQLSSRKVGGIPEPRGGPQTQAAERKKKSRAEDVHPENDYWVSIQILFLCYSSDERGILFLAFTGSFIAAV
jgi:hypothetical protein